jgi:ketosteroid isomerase-like protein
MYKAAVRMMIRRNVKALRAGDIKPLLNGYAEHAVLVFPGGSSWSGEHRGKPAIEAFLRRFVADGLLGEADEILVNGPPWRTTVCVRFSAQAKGDHGELVYDNRAILYARVVWGKIVYQEDYEDTHKIEAFEAYLAGRSPAASGA